MSACLSATDKNPSLVKLMGDIPKRWGFTLQPWNLIMLGGFVGFMFGGRGLGKTSKHVAHSRLGMHSVICIYIHRSNIQRVQLMVA